MPWAEIGRHGIFVHYLHGGGACCNRVRRCIECRELRAIKGWSEALQLMPGGSKWHLFIPSDLAYGERASGKQFGPTATLIFEVELISIRDKS